MHAQSCPTLGDPTDCSLPGSSDHGISQARILEWVAISSSRGSSRLRDQTCIGRQTLPLSRMGSPHKGKLNWKREERKEKERQGGRERKREKSASCSWCAENPPVVSPLRMHAKALLITHSATRGSGPRPRLSWPLDLRTSGYTLLKAIAFSFRDGNFKPSLGSGLKGHLPRGFLGHPTPHCVHTHAQALTTQQVLFSQLNFSDFFFFLTDISCKAQESGDFFVWVQTLKISLSNIVFLMLQPFLAHGWCSTIYWR